MVSGANLFQVLGQNEKEVAERVQGFEQNYHDGHFEILHTFPVLVHVTNGAQRTYKSNDLRHTLI